MDEPLETGAKAESFEEALRHTLKAIADGRPGTPEAGLDRERAELLALVAELCRFAQAVDAGVAYFLMELNVGPGMNTLQLKTASQMIGNRLQAFLAGQDGALEGLKLSLERNRRFLIDLNEAYRAAIPAGAAKLLEATSARAAAKKHKRVFGLGAKDALREVAAKQGDAASLPPEDLFQHYFGEAFIAELAKRSGA
ncbi:MAG: hypothetical protein ABFD65_08600 [Candidatus Polarisedimenticolia bacterium]